MTFSVQTCNSLHYPYSCCKFGCSYDCFCVFAIYGCSVCIIFASLLRRAALYDRERSRANPHAHGEAHLVAPYRPRGVSNTETVLSLVLSPRRPRLSRGLLQQCRIVPGCPKRRVLFGGGGSFPLWSFLPIGIGEHPASNSLAFGDLISLHSLSYPWVSGR